MAQPTGLEARPRAAAPAAEPAEARADPAVPRIAPPAVANEVIAVLAIPVTAVPKLVLANAEAPARASPMPLLPRNLAAPPIFPPTQFLALLRPRPTLDPLNQSQAALASAAPSNILPSSFSSFLPLAPAAPAAANAAAALLFLLLASALAAFFSCWSL